MRNNRMTLIEREVEVSLVGLEFLVNGLAAAQQGVFPHRHPFDRIDFSLSSVHEDREYNGEFAEVLLKLRNRLRGSSGRRRIRLTTIECSALALAVRVARKLGKDGEALSALEAKIEIFRKRTKRAAIRQNGKDSYQQHQQQWKRFVSWCRYHLLYLDLPRMPALQGPRMLRREQRAQLLEILEERIRARCTEAPPQEGLRHVVDLAIRELRRGRHDTTARQLLQDRETAAEFIWQFLEKRLELKLKREFQNLAVRMSENAARIWAVMQAGWNHPEPERVGVPPTPAACQQPTQESESTSRDQAVQTSLATVPESTVSDETKPLPNLCADHIATWFLEEVDPGYWYTVLSDAQTQVLRWPERYLNVPWKAVTQDDLVTETEPEDKSTNGPEFSAYLTEWLLRWTLALNPSPRHVHDLLQAGWAQAKRRLPYPLTPTLEECIK